MYGIIELDDKELPEFTKFAAEALTYMLREFTRAYPAAAWTETGDNGEDIAKVGVIIALN